MSKLLLAYGHERRILVISWIRYLLPSSYIYRDVAESAEFWANKRRLDFSRLFSGLPSLVIGKLRADAFGANKGIGLATVRQLAQQGVTVVLSAQDEKRGMNAVETLKREFGLSNVVFHQLDVQDPLSIANLAKYINAHFRKLDILVNNAGTLGVSVDEEGLKALKISSETWNYNDAVTCLDTNYYGCKRVIEALLPLLHLSTSGARIVNVSSRRSELKGIPDEMIRHELGDIQSLNEERIEKLLQIFLQDFNEGRLKSRGWSTTVPAYNLSKAALNAYTRVLAKRQPTMYINCMHPGYVKTDINWNSGVISPEEGAKGLMMLALLPDGGPSGCYFDQTNMAEF